MDESTTTQGSVGSAGDGRSSPDHGAGDGPRDALPDAAAHEDGADENGADENAADGDATPVGDPATAAVDDAAPVDPDLLARAEALADLPLAERADAFDRLNGDVQDALRAIEEA